MSTFRAFQTGLQAGQQQAKMRREDDARAKAAEAFGMGNFEGAVTPLMSAGLMQDAEAYERAGARRKEADATKAYAEAFRTGMGTGPQPDRRGAYQAVATTAGQQGDFGMMADMDQVLSQMDESQASQFASGMEFLGNTALGLKGVPPEQRGAAAVEILKNSPYGNPQIMAQIEQAAADGRITDQELDNFAMQTMSVADRIKAQRPELHNTGQAITATSFGSDGSPSTKVLYQDPQTPRAGDDLFRPATEEDRARWNLPAEGAFKINVRTGEPASISGARAANDFSQTEIRSFRDQADGLYVLKNAVQRYVETLEKMGGPQLLDTPLNAENVQALKTAHGLITEAIKDAGKLGALDQGVQNLVNAIIQDPVGWGTFGKSTDSIKQAANQLYSSIDFKLSRVPEEYRFGSTGQAPPETTQQPSGTWSAGQASRMINMALSKIPQQAIAELRADPSPEAVAEFNEHFQIPGAAEAILNGSR